MDAWTRELRSWLGIGDRQEALRTAQAYEEAARLRHVRADAVLAELLEQLRTEPATHTAGEQRLRLRPELVGRERALASLVRGWQAVQTRGATVVAVMRGTAGIGKSRLLDELGRRIGEGAGSRVTLRARPADRDMPYALVAAFAEAVADLPGALGLSAASASALVDLAPALSSTFRTAIPRPVSSEDMLRTRTLALQELLGCVAEEAPVAVLVDDLHWADDASRLLLSSLADRLTGRPVLLVITTRLHGRPWAIPEGATIVDLTPLGLEQMAALLTSLGSCEAALLTELAQILTDATGGVPMLALAALDLGLEQQVLRLDGEGWWCAGTDRFRRLIGPGGILERLIVDLPGSGVAMLAALALCGGPLEEPVLLASSGDRFADEVLRILATRGLLAQTPAGWELAHDRLADAVLATVHPAERRLIAQRCGQALLDVSTGTVRGLQVAGRLLMAAGHEDQHLAFARWLRAGRDPRLWRDTMASATAFLGDSVSPQQARQLARRVPWASRVRHGYDRLLRTVFLMLLLGVGGAVGLGSTTWWEPRAERLAIRLPDSSGGFLFAPPSSPSPGDSLPGIPIPMTVDFLDAQGRRTSRGPRQVSVHLLVHRGAVRMGGTTTRAPRLGQAAFDDLRLTGGGIVTVEVRAQGLPPVRSRRLYAIIGGLEHQVAGLTIVGGQINGQPLDSTQRRVTVRPGALLSGTLQYRFTTATPAAAMLAGLVPLWGDRRTNWMVLQAHPPHGEQLITVPFADVITPSRTIRAPDRPGRYRILFVQQGETEMRFIASATNWKLGTPQWFDGDDLIDLPRSAVDSLATVGFARWRRLVPKADPTRGAERVPHTVTGTVLEVDVRL